MPCNSCDRKLVLVGKWPGTKKCPNCDRIKIVDRPLAIEISKSRLDYLDGLFVAALKTFDKNNLLARIILEREKFSRSFIDQYQVFNLRLFVTYSILIKRITVEGTSSSVVANQQNLKQLIEYFSKYIEMLTDHSYLKDRFAELQAKSNFNPEKLSIPEKLSNFSIIFNEDFIPLSQTFANNQLYNDEEARRKLEEYSKEKKEVKLKSPPTDIETFISRNYEVLTAFYCGLLKSEIPAKGVFDFSNYQKLDITPEKVMGFANVFSSPRSKNPVIVQGGMFRVWLDRIFDSNLIEMEKAFVFSEENQNTFPLFVELNDQVIVPYATAFLVSRLLYPILHKELFKRETEKRSRQLEMVRTVEAFGKAGYQYYRNLTDKKQPSMEIDGIATRNREMWIVEVKGWGIGTYFEHRKGQDWLVRDLKGIVDGLKYSTIDGIRRRQRKVGLLEKVEFAKASMSIWGFNQDDYDAVNGVIIIRDYSPISEYKGIKIRSVNQVDSL